MKGYANPDVLVSTQWVADHLNDPDLRIVESNEDILLYDLGHVPGAVQIDWQKDLNDAIRRDYLSRQDFEVLMALNGIGNDTTVVFYGDKNNWWADGRRPRQVGGRGPANGQGRAYLSQDRLQGARTG